MTSKKSEEDKELVIQEALGLTKIFVLSIPIMLSVQAEGRIALKGTSEKDVLNQLRTLTNSHQKKKLYTLIVEDVRDMDAIDLTKSSMLENASLLLEKACVVNFTNEKGVYDIDDFVDVCEEHYLHALYKIQNGKIIKVK